MQSGSSPFTSSILKKTGIFYSYKVSLIFVLVYHSIKYLFAFGYKLGDNNFLWKAAKEDLETLFLEPVSFLLGAFVIKNAMVGFENLFHEEIKRKKIDQIFKSPEDSLNFTEYIQNKLSTRNQMIAGISVGLLFTTPLFLSVQSDDFTVFDINLLGEQEFLELAITLTVLGFVSSFFTGVGTFTVIIIFISIYQLGSDRSKLSLISFSDEMLDEYVKLGGMIYEELSLIKFTSNVQVIGTYLFNLTSRIILYLIVSSILFAVINISEYIVFLAMVVVIFCILASFVPQIRIHRILSSVKESTLELFEDLLETSRQKIFSKILTNEDQGETIEDIYSRMKFLKVQIDETKELITWAYDFPSMVKLIGGATISIILFAINIIYG
ncbi:MAG: hypothetical protein ACW98K_09035 [Candidatus Kariarchaeaceae archaeon]|jgi:hypothetical protein